MVANTYPTLSSLSSLYKNMCSTWRSQRDFNRYIQFESQSHTSWGEVGQQKVKFARSLLPWYLFTRLD